MTYRYKFEVAGSGADERTWTASGEITIDKLGDFPDVPMQALRQAFMQVTSGKAVFGQPGKGCRGPYQIHRLVLDWVRE